MTQSKYQHIFFDLDHTLWDFESNSRKTLHNLFEIHQLTKLGVPDFNSFIQVYELVNEQMWAAYRKGELDKASLREGRFPKVLERWEISDRKLADSINEQYLSEGPKQPGLMPNTMDTLNYLEEKYHIHLITNGFKEVQSTKLKSSGLEGRFKTITTSEEVGVLKPNSKVFHHALNLASATPQESIYVGDHFETDVVGSKKAGIDQVFFNPKKAKHPPIATFEIEDLSELMDLL